MPSGRTPDRPKASSMPTSPLIRQNVLVSSNRRKVCLKWLPYERSRVSLSRKWKYWGYTRGPRESNSRGSQPGSTPQQDCPNFRSPTGRNADYHMWLLDWRYPTLVIAVDELRTRDYNLDQDRRLLCTEPERSALVSGNVAATAYPSTHVIILLSLFWRLISYL